MRDLTKYLDTKVASIDKLTEFGFKKAGNEYIFEKILSNNNFKAVVKYTNFKLTSKVIDLETGGDYVIVDLDRAIGKYAAEIKVEYDEIIKDILETCFKKEVFRFPQSKRIINYIECKYGCELEFLWKKFPKDAVYRNSENNKWFVALMVVEKSKLSLEGSQEVEIIDLKHNDVDNIVDNRTILKGYHMNKNHWISIVLDDSISDDEIFNLIDLSYQLVLK